MGQRADSMPQEEPMRLTGKLLSAWLDMHPFEDAPASPRTRSRQAMRAEAHRRREEGLVGALDAFSRRSTALETEVRSAGSASPRAASSSA